jgi:tRNA (uracil-5-)-methyltransferase TRM9
MNLYSEHAKTFSNTRKSPWKGWEKLSDYIQQEKQLSILDIGCGNGRFLKFLNDEPNIKINDYTGLDYSKEMLEIAAQAGTGLKPARTDGEDAKIFHINFIQADVNKLDWDKGINQKFNLIVAFGLMHHIESEESRINFMQKAVSLLEPGGLIILSFWRFAENEKFLNSHRLIDKEIEAGLKPARTNDYILKFGNKGAFRFCHYYNENEINSLYKNTDLVEVDRFREDGNDRRMNLYVVSRK